MKLNMQFDYGVDSDEEAFIALKEDQIKALISSLEEAGFDDDEASIVIFKKLLDKVQAVELDEHPVKRRLSPSQFLSLTLSAQNRR